MSTEYKLGRVPSAPDAPKLYLSKYLDVSAMPTVPANFGHEKDMTVPFGMLGNDQWGCCVFAGAAHEHMIWEAANKRAVSDFTADSVLSDYSAVTGFDPGDPDSDRGTDMATAARYRQMTGIVDGDGNRHKIGAYLALEPGNMGELLSAAYLFGAVGVGIVVTEQNMERFKAGKPWIFRRNGNVLGGHYVPVVARRGHYLVAVTWGRLQLMTPSFYMKQSDEAFVYLSDEYLTGDISPEGFDRGTLLRDLAQL